VGPDALFGIVTFSNRVGLYDVQGAVPSVRHVVGRCKLTLWDPR
jgi:hypothetical protein